MTVEAEKKMEQSGDMNSPMRKDDHRYVEATIRQLPSLTDSRERRIIEVLKEKLLTTPWAKDAFVQLRDVVIANWQDAISHLDQPGYVHDVTQKGAVEAARLVNSRIVSGEENLNSLGRGKPVMILSNHLGTFKLVSMSPEELREKGIEHAVPNIYYPPVTYYMPFVPVAERLGNHIYEASFEQPLRLGEYFRATGSVDVPPPDFRKERTPLLTEWTRKLIEEHPDAALTIFPEGGTTGKRSGGAIYDLENFHKGAFVIASNLNMPMLPVAQFFNPNSGFELGVFEPIHLSPGASEKILMGAAENTRVQMQGWLNQKQAMNKSS